MIIDNEKLTQSYISKLKEWFKARGDQPRIKVHEITEALQSLGADIEMEYQGSPQMRDQALNRVMELIERNTTYSEQMFGQMMDIN